MILYTFKKFIEIPDVTKIWTLDLVKPSLLQLALENICHKYITLTSDMWKI
jgi:hypothetical protein